MASLGVPRAAFLCWLHDPAPTATKPWARKGPEPPTSTLLSVVPQTVPRPALEVLPAPKTWDREAVGAGGGRGAAPPQLLVH